MTDKGRDKGMLGITPEELDRIIDAATDWIAIVDLSGRLKYFNSAFRNQVRSIAVGQTLSDVLVDKYRTIFKQALLKSQDGNVVQVELGIRCDDLIRHLAVRVVPLIEDGAYSAFFIVGFDITAEKAACDELVRRELMLQRAEQLGGLASWSWDIKRDIGYWSDNLFRIAGYEPQSFTPRYEMFMNMVHPEDRSELTAMTEAIYRREATVLERPFEIEFRLQRPDGEIVHVLGRGEARCDEHGEPVETIGTILDITERRNADEQLRDRERQLIEAQQLGKIGSWEFDLKAGELNWSQELFRIAGMESNSHPLSEKLFDQLFEAPENSLLGNLRKSASLTPSESQATEFSREAKLIRPDKSERTVFERARVVFDSNQRAMRFQGIVQDITDMKQMEIALRSAHDRLLVEHEMLENKNVTLKEVLAQIEDESNAVRQQISQNVERLVRPALAKLRSAVGEHGRVQLDALESTIIEITSPFISEIERRFVNLTPREMQICHHIRSGLRSKEIADLLAISVQTVEKFRQKIRKKLGIEGTTVNLSSYLRSVKPK